MTTAAPPAERTDTHEGTRPKKKDPERYCHLMVGGVSLCGKPRAWGIPDDSPNRAESPCDCGLARCPECLA